MFGFQEYIAILIALFCAYKIVRIVHRNLTRKCNCSGKRTRCDKKPAGISTPSDTSSID